MPRGDKTGPEGMGPMTGRQMGFCTGNQQAGFNNAAFGRGLGRGFGFGSGRGGRRMTGRNRNFFNENQVSSIQQGKEMIENEIDALRNQINSLENKLKEME